jgi:hypothetical protein
LSKGVLQKYCNLFDVVPHLTSTLFALSKKKKKKNTTDFRPPSQKIYKRSLQENFTLTDSEGKKKNIG